MLEPYSQHDERGFDRYRRRERADGPETSVKTAARFRKRKVRTNVPGMQQRRNKHWTW